MYNEPLTIYEEAANAIEAMTNDDILEWLEELGIATNLCYDDLSEAERILAEAADSDLKIAHRIVYD